MTSFNPLSYIDLGAFWQGFLSFLPKFLAGVLVFAAFYVLYHATVLILRSALERKKLHASIITLTVKSYKYVLITVGFVVALEQMGVNLGAALTGLGILGVGLGFAARDTVSNYISGVTIFWDKPFYVGDYIETQGLYGRVTEITMRSTRIRTLQNEYLVVPNQTIVDELVINHSKNGEVRVEIPISISYQDSITRARRVLLSLVNPDEDERLSAYLKPTVVADELGDSGVELLFRVWISRPEDEKAVHHDYLERAKEALDAYDITIPYPQRVLHVQEEPREEWHAKHETPLSARSH